MLSGFVSKTRAPKSSQDARFHMAKATPRKTAKGQKASASTARKTASKTKPGKPAAKKPAARTPAARKPAARTPAARAPAAKPAPKQGAKKKPSARATKKAPCLEVDDCLLDEDRFDEPVSLHAAIVIELGDYKGMGYLRAMKGVTEIVVPPPPGGYATRREIYEAVDAALDAPLSEHGVEGYNLSVRDCYVDQACDGMFVTEVTEDTVTAVCDYCS